MERNIDEAMKEKIINCGAFGYDEKRMAAILELTVKEVKELMDSESEFEQLYERGKMRGDYVLDLKLFEMAQAGDLKALEKYEQRKMVREMD